MNMNKLIAFAAVAASAAASLPLCAATVAYWPLAGENGVRTTTSDVFQNIVNPGMLDAVPISIKTGVGETGVGDGGSTYCPIGTSAFPSGYGVYDPVAEPHNDIPYYGSMAHFRISDEVLPTEKFLHFTRTERAANEADDVVLSLGSGRVPRIHCGKSTRMI